MAGNSIKAGHSLVVYKQDTEPRGRCINRNSKVRQRIFREVARNAKLQEQLLAILGKCSAAQTDFFVELTKKPTLRQLIFGIAAIRI